MAVRLTYRIARLGKHGKFAEHRAGGSLCNPQPQALHSGGLVQADQAPRSDAGGRGERLPGSRVPAIHGDAVNALSQADSLAQTNHTEGGGLCEIEDYFGRENGIVGGPNRPGLSIHQVGGSISRRVAANVGGRHLGLGGQVARKSGAPVIAECAQRRDVLGLQQAVAVRRDIQQQVGAAARGLVVEVDELRRRLHAPVFVLGPEPAGPDGNVALGGQPVRTVAVAGWRFALADIARRCRPAVRAHRIAGGPAGISSDAAFISNPAHVGPYVAKDTSAGLELSYQGPGVGPVVVGALVDGAFIAGAAVHPLAAIGAVVPDLKNRAVAGQQFGELAAIDVDVWRRPVVGVIAVPRRNVDAERQFAPRRRRRKIAHHVAFRSPPGAVADGMIGGPGGPQTEAVVMLAGEDHSIRNSSWR